MKKNNIVRSSRTGQIPPRTGACVVCGHVGQIVGFDHDFAPLHSGKGDVCQECFQAARAAEDALLNAGLVIPNDSIMEDGKWL